MATLGWRYLNGPVTIREYPEDQTGGSFIAGDLVALSAGEVVLATADEIYGIALKSAAASGTIIPVMIVTSEMEFVAEADATTTVAMEGEEYDINFTAGSQSVDIAGDTYDNVIIQELDPRDGPHTGSGGRVIVKFAPACLQSHKGTTA